MYQAFIDSLSLKNPTVLNDYNVHNVIISLEPESSTSSYHYNFLLKTTNQNLLETITKIQQEMLSGWYSFFWNPKKLFIVFNSHKFVIDLPNGWVSQNYFDAQNFGRSQEIPEIYLDYKKYFQKLILHTL